tara:strand:- start:16 stop:123 length:108 start_codon:yes stop_codon:yes gene_type:complete
MNVAYNLSDEKYFLADEILKEIEIFKKKEENERTH